jgi:hypothetical protein
MQSGKLIGSEVSTQTSFQKEESLQPILQGLGCSEFAQIATSAKSGPNRFIDALVVQRKSRATILLPASLSGLCAEGLFLAVADNPDAAGSHAGVNQILLGRVGAILAESQVVLVGAALVAVAANKNLCG